MSKKPKPNKDPHGPWGKKTRERSQQQPKDCWRTAVLLGLSGLTVTTAAVGGVVALGVWGWRILAAAGSEDLT